MNDKPHLSPSTINQYLRCSAQTMFKMEVGPKPPGIAFLYGRSYDDAINEDMGQKIDSHEDLPEDDVKDAFVTSWDKNKELTEFFAKDKPTEIREIGIKSIGQWTGEIAPTVQPSAVQKKLPIDFPSFDYNILQYADIITDDDRVIDNKTAARSISKNGDGSLLVPADHRLQLTMYGMGFGANYGKQPKSLGLDYAIKTKAPKFQRVSWEPNEEDKELALNLMVRVGKGIENNVFIPNRSSFMCNKRMCGWWRECQKMFGGKIKD